MGVRIERLKEVIRETAAEVILNELNDPRIGFVTVTQVDLSPDLSHAVISVSIFGSEAQKRTTMRGLQTARGRVQSRIASRMQTRVTPHIAFELDESIEQAFRIQEKIREARASDPDGGKSPLPEDGAPSESPLS